MNDASLIFALLVVALAAGWIDAVVGGGGLVQIPMLMLMFPALPVASALGTNKLVGVFGTSAAAVTYARRTKIDGRIVAAAGALAVVFAGLGAAAATAIPSSFFRPIVMVLLTLVAIFVAFRPQLGAVSGNRMVSRTHLLAAILIAGCVIGLYDGVLGPGTGTFLIITFVVSLGLDFVHGSAMAKVVNAGTNFGALVVFAAQGHVQWSIGLLMACGNIAGALIGARTALSCGTKFVRVVLLTVVGVLLVKLGIDQWN